MTQHSQTANAPSAEQVHNRSAGTLDDSKQPHQPDPHCTYKTMADTLHQLPSPDKMARSSFSSVRETIDDFTQTFTSSRIASTQLPPAEHAVEDTDSDCSSTCLTDLEMAIENLSDLRGLKRIAITDAKQSSMLASSDRSPLEKLPYELFGKPIPCAQPRGF